jgi:hypothetical protein
MFHRCTAAANKEHVLSEFPKSDRVSYELKVEELGGIAVKVYPVFITQHLTLPRTDHLLKFVIFF